MLPFGSSSMCQVNYKTVRTEKAFKIFRFLREYNRFSLIRLWCSFFLQLLGHRVHLNVLGSEKISIKRRYVWEGVTKNTKFKTLANRGGGGVLPAIVFQNLSWTPKTCFAFSLDCRLLISSILDEFECYHFVASQQSEPQKNDQFEPIITRQ